MNWKKVMNRNNFIIVGSSVLLFALSGCTLFKSAKQEPSLLVVNVLNKDLYDDCHIPGSIQVDFDKIMEVSQKWSKSTKIIVYCANYSCSASASAVRSLIDLGFDASEYAAGMAGWKQSGLPVNGPALSAYLLQGNEQSMEIAHDIPVISTQELKELLDKQEKKVQ